MPSRDSCRFRNCEGYQIARQPFFNTSLRTVCFDLAVSDITLFWLGIATAAEQDPASLQRRKAALEVQKLELEVAKLTKDDGELRNWLTGIFGLLAGIGGTVAMVWVARRTRFGTLDQSVHDERLKLYPGLVKACARLALYFPISDPSAASIGPRECGTMGQTMSTWYFAGGGLLLSVKSRDAYFKLARALTRASLAQDLRVPMFPRDADDISVEKVNEYRSELKREADLDDVENWKFGIPESGKEDPVARFRDHVFLQRLSSKLRTALAKDLRSRRRPS